MFQIQLESTELTMHKIASVTCLCCRQHHTDCPMSSRDALSSNRALVMKAIYACCAFNENNDFFKFRNDGVNFHVFTNIGCDKLLCSKSNLVRHERDAIYNRLRCTKAKAKICLRKS